MSMPVAEPKSVFYKAFTRDGFKCVYCDRNLLEDLDIYASSHLDHLRPKKYGGEDNEEFNRVSSCGVCNSIKGSFDPSPGEIVTAESFSRVVQVAREYILEKRCDGARCSYVRDYKYWLEEAAEINKKSEY